MPAVNRCPTCQTELPADAPAGLCPACLLRAGMTSDHVEAGTRTSRPTFTPPTPAELAPHFPQLEILELIGQGGMGAVYQAKQARLDRYVALKILPKDAEKGQEFADRFTREAKAMARLSHPNIIAIHDYGEAGGWYYFVMEYVDGVNLRQAMKAATIKPSDAMAMVGQICDALQYAHEENVVHRDIKPENILLTKKGRVKIADFGLAKLLGLSSIDRHLTATQQVMGTVGYMAPEQMEGSKSIDHRADIYALGVVFYELLTGELPMGRFAPPSQKVQIDVRIDEVVLKSLEREPSRRYQSASQVKHEMDRISAGPMAVSPAIETPASAATIEAMKVRLPILGAALLLLGLCQIAVVIALILNMFNHRAANPNSPTNNIVNVATLFSITDFLVLGTCTAIGGVLIMARVLWPVAMISLFATVLPLATIGTLISAKDTNSERYGDYIRILDAFAIPFGIWGIIELSQHATKAHFRWPLLPMLATLWRETWNRLTATAQQLPRHHAPTSPNQSYALETSGIVICVLSCVLYWPFYHEPLRALGFESRVIMMARDNWIIMLLPSILTGLVLIIAGPRLRYSAILGLVMLLGGIAQLATTLSIVPEAPNYLNTWLLLILGILLGLLGAWRLRWWISGPPAQSSATVVVASDIRPRRRWLEWGLAFVGIMAAVGASAGLAYSLGWLRLPSSQNAERLNKQQELQAQLLGNWTKAEGPEFHVVAFRNDGTFDEQTAKGTVSGQYLIFDDDRIIIEAPNAPKRIVNVVVLGDHLTLKETNGSVLRFKRSNPIPPSLP